MRAPLPLGRVVATPGALKLLSEAREDLYGYLARHATGDWGELCAFDRRQNEIALREGYRVLSSYPVGRECVWVITEADRSVTTILLPEASELLEEGESHDLRIGELFEGLVAPPLGVDSVVDIVHPAEEHGHGLFWEGQLWGKLGEGHLKLLWTRNSDGPRFTLQTTQHSSSLSGHRASARG